MYVRCGGQGLRHVRIRLRAQGTTPMFRFAAELTADANGGSVARTAPAHTLPFYATAGGCDSPDILLIVHPPSAELAEQPATLDVTVTGTDARELQATRRVTIDITHMSCEQ